ncbi:WD-repeat protein [Tritrichomonas foetus]|uniref:WD-repeat protein n=1 Tax=Tritrichomonas foetus TaxID=1144522 RepID=A0A1J4KYQ3_9EUKA|nr:WD-repeat protein [Tritrichomonas foetus]|eukprot:OHT14838.1 WD-repeat protein [Tritrichomonas foetus]
MSKSEAKVTPYAGLKACCRHITSRESSSDKIQFVVGTSVIGKPNQIQIIEYDDIQETIQCIQALDHPDEIWWVACHPTEIDLMMTISAKDSARVSSTRLYRIPQQDSLSAFGSPEKQPLELISTFETDDKFAQRVCYLSNKSKCLISCAKTLNVFDVQRPGSPICLIDAVQQFQSANNTKIKSNNANDDQSHNDGLEYEISASAADPLHSDVVACCIENTATLWDLRSGNVAHHIEDNQDNVILDIAFNENKPWWVCTGGSDGMLRCWDVRVGKPRCEFRASSHWLTRTIPSSSHEQLILTAGSDAKVRVINSREFAFQNDGKLPDGEIIKSIRHDDTVCAATWASNPWVFASVSYKGQVNVCQLPSTVVDAILMGDDDDFSD